MIGGVWQNSVNAVDFMNNSPNWQEKKTSVRSVFWPNINKASGPEKITPEECAAALDKAFGNAAPWRKAIKTAVSSIRQNEKFLPVFILTEHDFDSIWLKFMAFAAAFRDSLPRVFAYGSGIQILFRQYASHFEQKRRSGRALSRNSHFAGLKLLGWPAGPFYCAEHGSYLVWLFACYSVLATQPTFRGAPTRKAGERSAAWRRFPIPSKIFQMDETAL